MKSKQHNRYYLFFGLGVLIASYYLLSMGGVDGLKSTYRIVQLLEKKTDDAESTYEVGAYLNGTDFSSIGQELASKIEQEWKNYSAMTEEQRLISSHLWGLVSFQDDYWNECEKAIGYDVENPLESIDWLNKTGYFGMESTDPAMPVKHIQVTANAARSPMNVDGKLQEISIAAGYNVDDIRITLNAALCADDGTYQTGSVCNGYAVFEEESTTTGSGIPVLIVITNESNNNDYYNGDYYDPTAYWVKDNVFYILRVLGDEANKEEIQDTLNRILGEI